MGPFRKYRRETVTFYFHIMATVKASSRTCHYLRPSALKSLGISYEERIR